jgi:hypothetical protein
MPRFAILAHDHPFPHWDLLLEAGTVCRTWRLMDIVDSMNDVEAEEMFDHRWVYLDYEGPVSGDRGTVTRWDRGMYEWREQQDDLCEVKLSGARWQGTIRLSRVEGNRWRCVPLA